MLFWIVLKMNDYKALRKVDRLTLRIVLFNIQGFFNKEISRLFDLSEKAIYRRMDRLKEKNMIICILWSPCESRNCPHPRLHGG